MHQSIESLLDFVMVEGREPVTDSRKVAKHFGKRHDNVLRDIAKVECSDRFAKLNFEVCFENNELQNGKPLKFYRMTKDGFMFLVMGFTGRAAASMKEAFIEAFNAMAEYLRSGLWQRRLDAEAAFQQGCDRASIHGRGLRRWRDEKPERLQIIADLDKQMQIPLLFN